MSSDLIQVGAQMVKFDSRRNSSFFLGFKTQENVRADIHHSLSTAFEKDGWLCFLPEMSDKQIQIEDVINLPPLPVLQGGKEQKTHAQRLRAVLYRYWELVLGKPNPAGLKTEAQSFNLWYADQMERMIEHFKKQLPKV